MTGIIRKTTALLTLLVGASVATTAHAAPIIDVQIRPPELVVMTPPPPPPPVKMVKVVPGRVYVPAHYRIDRRGRRVLVPGRYERRVSTKRVIVRR